VWSQAPTGSPWVNIRLATCKRLGVPKRWHLNYRRRGIAQKKAYDVFYISSSVTNLSQNRRRVLQALLEKQRSAQGAAQQIVSKARKFQASCALLFKHRDELYFYILWCVFEPAKEA
jgi:hypothetical protein